MRLFGQPAHGLSHAVEEEGLGRISPSVTVRRGNQFFGLWHRDGCKQVREQRPQGSTEPDVEVIRQVRVSDVVVVRRVSGYESVTTRILGCRIHLRGAAGPGRRQVAQCLLRPSHDPQEVPPCAGEGVHVGVVPDHRHRLSPKGRCRLPFAWPPARLGCKECGLLAYGQTQIHPNRLGVRGGPGSTVLKRRTVVSQPRPYGVSSHPLDRLANEIGEGRERNELTRREEVPEPCQAVLHCPEVPVVVCQLEFGSPTWRGHSCYLLHLSCRCEIDPTAISLHDNRHQPRAYPARPTRLLDVVPCHRRTRKETAEIRTP